ncbi:hypothetical protein VTN96DRAFT_1689 [Rasamsonia emersonii]|uniref:Required for respiratory growth protein 9, mitochondrial n=1 Tax=Rasamsonia emersonii (strain ATCC 16479 / CBS 393.64 / IMI 116815) TaxID=1408163 RepID=A0A0F4YFB0_RASE3|nr:Required for respiratory growth protein 9, mitochondrial Precursor [Rasamsonia emersonii CBS 393.64]KKA16815.1 Required for respiratory growth protein 9, mitochondrial Precursor [Rasamsonia emersonii CBS 393.64]
MSSTCVVSKGFTLSNVLQSILRAEIAPYLQVRPRSLATQSSRFPSYTRCSQIKSPYHRRFFSSPASYDSSIQPSVSEASRNTEPEKPRDTSTDAAQDNVVEGAKSGIEESKSTPTKAASKSEKKATREKGKSQKAENANEDSAAKRTQQETKKKKKEPWQLHKEAMKRKFPEGWNPPKKLSPDAIDGIRQLHASAPDKFTTPVLAEEFKVSPEAIRRILKSKWRPSEEEMEDRRRRWRRRHERIWSQMVELGLRPRRKSAEPFSDARILDED